MNPTPGRVILERAIGGAFIALMILALIGWAMWPLFQLADLLGACRP